MNKLILLPIVSILSIGCAQSFQVEPTKELTIIPELMQYVEQFQADSNDLGRPLTIDNLIVQFDTLDNRVIANCTRGNGTPVIRFSTTYYNYYKSQGMDSDIERVMYHELGHCILNLDHNDTKSGQYNWPSSIMNTYHFAGWLYSQYKHNYLLELFFAVPNNFENNSSFASKVSDDNADKYNVTSEVGCEIIDHQ